VANPDPEVGSSGTERYNTALCALPLDLTFGSGFDTYLNINMNVCKNSPEESEWRSKGGKEDIRSKIWSKLNNMQMFEHWCHLRRNLALSVWPRNQTSVNVIETSCIHEAKRKLRCRNKKLKTRC
jgi:hypothetical protein